MSVDLLGVECMGWRQGGRVNVGETSWRLLVTWLFEREDEGNWTRGWLTVGPREVGKVAIFWWEGL